MANIDPTPANNIEYKILSSVDSNEALEHAVIEATKEGWQPQGGIAIYVIPSIISKTASLSGFVSEHKVYREQVIVRVTQVPQ